MIKIFRILFLLFPMALCGQSMHLHLNINEALPINNKYKGQLNYWYNDSMGVSAGGFGLGISLDEIIFDKHKMKYQVNVLTHKYFDESVLITDSQGIKLYDKMGITTNVSIVAHTIIYTANSVKNGFIFGIGGGVRKNIYSKSDYGKGNVTGVDVNLNFKNESVKQFVFLIPIEVRYSFNKLSLAFRSEMDVTRSSNLERFKRERFIALNFEIGYQISK
ncbi:MAG: hypothetical protein IPM42_05240 [Saprospiraceae bacterium]|nr:hypothetical protein [Saprospiraceae bacterium]